MGLQVSRRLIMDRTTVTRTAVAIVESLVVLP